MLIFTLGIILNIAVSIMGFGAINGRLSSICGLLMIVGFIWYCVNLSKFAKLQTNEENRSSVNKVVGGNILLVAGSIIIAIVEGPFIISLILDSVSTEVGLTFLSIMPILILSIPSIPPYLAYRMMEKGYHELSQSQTFNPKCQNGFKKLKQSATLKKHIVLTYFVLRCICIYLLMNISSGIELLQAMDKVTVILAIAGLAIFILGIDALVKWFTGWEIVKNNGPEETEEGTTHQPINIKI